MSFRSNYHIFAQWKKKQQYQKFTVGISYLLLCISSSLHLSINEDHNTHRWKSKHWKSARDSSQRKIKTITKINTKKPHKTYLIPSNPSSELFIVKIGARAYALATRRLPSNTMILAQISSSIWSHLSSTSWICS